MWKILFSEKEIDIFFSFWKRKEKIWHLRNRKILLIFFSWDFEEEEEKSFNTFDPFDNITIKKVSKMINWIKYFVRLKFKFRKGIEIYFYRQVNEVFLIFSLIYRFPSLIIFSSPFHSESLEIFPCSHNTFSHNIFRGLLCICLLFGNLYIFFLFPVQFIFKKNNH